MKPFERPLRIGLAIGKGRVIAVARAGRVTRTATAVLHAPPDGAAAAGVLSAAFVELRDRLAEAFGEPGSAARVHVALMPTLVDVRLVPLPPLRAGEAKAVLLRNASRHFLGAGERVIGVRTADTRSRARWLGRSPAGPARPSLAAAAPAPLLDAVYRAAEAAGWRVVAVAPAHAAWIAAAAPATAKVRDQSYALVALDDATAHVLRIEAGDPVALRRVPATADEIADAAGEPGPLLVLGAAAERETLTRQLAARGWIMVADPAAAANVAEAAAAYAHDAGLELVPLNVLVERQHSARSLALRIAGVAAVLFVAAAGLELWGARRELAAVRASRAEVAPTVAPLILARDSVDRLNARAVAIDQIAASSPSYTRALLDLALLLPRDAHLTRLHATGDTVLIQAIGARAGEAIESLRSSPSLRDVRLRGIIERELEAGATATERFTLVARLAEDEPPEPGASASRPLGPADHGGAAAARPAPPAGGGR